MMKKEERRKKENKIDLNVICMRFDFPTLSKVSGTSRILLYLDFKSIGFLPCFSLV